jgi:hypothetical protein
MLITRNLTLGNKSIKTIKRDIPGKSTSVNLRGPVDKKKQSREAFDPKS